MCNALPSLHDANATFKESNTAEAMSSVLAGIFSKHNVDGLLGVQLLHRHFMLGNNEYLIEMGDAPISDCRCQDASMTACSDILQ
jgi:hypothetical protein